MARYIDADELLRKLPEDLPYKASVKRVLMQAPEANVAPIADTVRKMQERLKADAVTIQDHTGKLGVVVGVGNIDDVAREMLESEK